MQQNRGVTGAAVSHVVTHTEQTEESSLSKATAKQRMNAGIIQANLEASINSGNEPLALLYKAAIEGINEALEPTLGENAIQNAYGSGLDVTPEATADRIVSMSMAFFGEYQKVHPELSEEEAAIKFAEVMGGGIDQGFAEAREILDGLKVLEGDIASNIDTTYELVQAGLKAFVESHTTQAMDDKTPIE
ncbi:MAG: DUF5610 domain-containing protein [Gammaproteobacteria bacterium]|jgi:hypothetical protein|nr:DUF5610 domain-containing protein [Gammaproteobacteria bacterium]MBT4605465.1 DUF5610 domain-containing protein [Thiotrichales bacterium]MBT3473388.1 DUF5610 domain-containing protein [Gammaproteobacteria bacterium]MBT3967445.1 DUF5610 domain-containing protein [Gammaproteobacteria bacterium]MBT4080847.1 DUF5610 domain-containing protein [Gammaproteobacteria bacterium]